MKFDSSMVAVWLAALAPSVVFILAIKLYRRQRKRTTKPPQTEKLLRPPGFSLSISLEKTFDSVVDCLLAATVLSAFSAACVVTVVNLFDSKAPIMVLALSLVVAVSFITVCL